MNKEILDRKYAQLLLKNCLTFNNTDSLLIEYQPHEHEDFMIGTPDLEITADTNKGKQYIFKKGNFSL